jgi:hypothetical protein
MLQDFPLVIQKLRQLLEELLKRKPLDVNQLIAMMEQLQLSFAAPTKTSSVTNL